MLSPITCGTATDSLASDETPTSRRERKDTKCLVRAANRAKVVTQEEIRYVESVLHSAEGVSGAEGVSPASVEEMQLIEDHLRYNANVYNSHSSRCDLKRFAKIPDVDVDFEGEMERVLDTFRITELVKRNVRNRGLQGKDLRNFDTLVETFKDAVVEDLVLVKKDMMEIRMRRAGYLRYTNKTAYEIVEDRYSEKDWKTGERIKSSSSDSSGLTSPSEEIFTPLEYVVANIYGTRADANFSTRSISEPSISPNCSVPDRPDRRHLQRVHTRISGDDGLGQKVIEPYHAPLLPLTPITPHKKPTVLQLKVIENKENGIAAGLTNRGWLRREVAKQNHTRPLRTAEDDDLLNSPLSIRVTVPNRPVWGKSRAIPRGRIAGSSARDEEAFPALNPKVNTVNRLSYRPEAHAVQSPTDCRIVGLDGPEREIIPNYNNQEAHPVVSQKKAKKTQLGAKRKAKKINEPEEKSSSTVVNEAHLEVAQQGSGHPLLGSPVLDSAHNTLKESAILSPKGSMKDAQVYTPVKASVEDVAELVVSVLPSCPSAPQTTHGKHDHWMRFSRAFIVDQLTAPLLQSFAGCSHGSSCLFESNGIPDCPFHEPRKLNSISQGCFR